MAKQTKRILIIEDEKPLAQALELKLTSAGFDVKIAGDGEEGIKILEEESYDLVMLDLIMPKKDGFAVLTEIKNKKINTNVIIMSNLAQEEDVKRAKELGAKDYFVKADTPIANIVEYINKII